MALDSGEVGTVEDGYALFSRYRMAIAAGNQIARSRVHQVALLTMVNVARRSLLGGVRIVGDIDVPMLVEMPGGHGTLLSAILALGGTPAPSWGEEEPLVMLGTAEIGPRRGVTLVATFDGWRGGVAPLGEINRLPEREGSVLGAVLSAGLAISEVFQNLRGNVVAGRRNLGLSLWRPGAVDWMVPDGEPESFVAPSRLWLVGLGHLGQAYLWTLAMLPYASPQEVLLTLQDFDRITVANDSTSVLSNRSKVGRHKTREMAAWLEARGFETRIVERKFSGDVVLRDHDPRVLLCGVDNLEARAALEDANFDLIVEAGLGAGPSEYLAMRMHTFPASVSSREKWGGVEGEKETGQGGAYDDLLQRGAVDECGLVQLATRTVGAPFVGIVASALVIAEVLRRLNGGEGVEVVDLMLRSPKDRLVVGSSSLPPRFNPGYAELDG